MLNKGGKKEEDVHGHVHMYGYIMYGKGEEKK